MRRELTISDVRFAPARPKLRSKGVCGWASITLDGLAVRRLGAGRYAVSFPSRCDASGRRHAYVTPLSDEPRRAIEEEVLRHLRQGNWIS